MNANAPILPLLIPLLTALLQMVSARLPFQRVVGLLATALLVLGAG